MSSSSSTSIWGALILLSIPLAAHAEWQVKPSIGVNFGQKTTFVGSDPANGPAKLSFGVAGVLIGNVIGVEADFGRRSSIIRSANVADSSVTTLTGNITVALPKHLAEYTLRPYLVGGAGVMFVRIDQAANLFDTSGTMNAVDVGGGVTGFLTPRIGVSWDVRHFRNIGENPALAGGNFGLGPPQLSFWRANMALAIRY